MLQTFLLAFIPLFVAIDPVGIIPLYLGLTHDWTHQEKKTLVKQAVLTALCVGLVFGAGGHAVFQLIGISDADFRIAGGLLLLIFSVREIFGTSPKRTDGESPDQFLGVVPLGIPLIVGPAAITTLLILHETHGFLTMTMALILNLFLVWILLSNAERIVRKLGDVTPKVVGKIIAIFLAAIGVMMIRKGIISFFPPG